MVEKEGLDYDRLIEVEDANNLINRFKPQLDGAADNKTAVSLARLKFSLR
jgi:hypothetical protein